MTVLLLYLNKILKCFNNYNKLYNYIDTISNINYWNKINIELKST